MSAINLDGIKTGNKIEIDLRFKIEKQKKIKARCPGLAVIIAGDDKPSHTYVRLKHKKSLELGIYSELHALDKNISQKDIINLIVSLNKRDDIDGILVQLPLPAHLDTYAIIECINPEKDVDGFHPENVGKLALGHPKFIPCTPFGVIKLLEDYSI